MAVPVAEVTEDPSRRLVKTGDFGHVKVVIWDEPNPVMYGVRPRSDRMGDDGNSPALGPIAEEHAARLGWRPVAGLGRDLVKGILRDP